MATTASLEEKTPVARMPDDMECTVYGNLFGIMIALGGLLAGVMVSERSLDYWREDFVSLALLVVLGFRLSRNFITILSPPRPEEISPMPKHSPPKQKAPLKQHVQQEQAAVAQLPASSGTIAGMTPDQVVEQVVKRIKSQKEKAAQNNKLVN